MMKKYFMSAFIMCLLFSVNSCKTNSNKTNNTDEVAVNVPDFNADSAYQYIQKQVDFGSRVPNTKAHVLCGEYLAGKLAEYGAKVTNQYVDLIAFDGTVLKARNIIGSYDPANKKRIFLFAHWDSRPWSDNDPDEKNHHTPVLGANDGGSGVGVLLEIARLIHNQAPVMGIDIVFFDAEDYGAPGFYKGLHKDEYWCLGSQYWSRYPHVEGYNARFGILLDMVGGEHATFYREEFSERYAQFINKKVWKAAKALGYNSFFIDERNGGVTDDHLFVNEIAHIPSIDIISYDENAKLSGFGDFWHTVNDNMHVIDKATLKAVGQTVLQVVYNEK